MVRARTTEEYIRLIEEAIYETEELRVAAEYDMESMGAAAGFVDTLEASMRELYNSMKEGSYRFANRYLPYMELLNKQNNRSLPFKHLLNVINTSIAMGWMWMNNRDCRRKQNGPLVAGLLIQIMVQINRNSYNLSMVKPDLCRQGSHATTDAQGKNELFA